MAVKKSKKLKSKPLKCSECGHKIDPTIIKKWYKKTLQLHEFLAHGIGEDLPEGQGRKLLEYLRLREE